ncbi:RagB/SusD family protein [Pedobacter sp. MC2016-24]|uniref:RagB/SusD family protein n=1 Tax=Pedobacter sp. MC2016-24 TaxID=2780090 RepID=UPI001D160A7F|nr:RagB/SusD family protein [Pedobacter sp. MC2016-24]
MKKILFIKMSVLIAIMAITLGGCKKVFEVLPEDKLDINNAYKNVADADAAVIGIYGKFQNLAKQYVLLNEVRADLLDVTNNADPYLKQLNTHSVTGDNPYADPRPFYEVILNCNDVLKNFNIMNEKHLMSVDDYQKRYSDILTLRCFLYLQLGIQYGSVPYVTDALSSVDDLKNESLFPKLNLDALLDKLIADMKQMPYISSYSYPTGSSLSITTDGSNTQRMFINKYYMLGELQLWKGNYLEAAKNYKNVMETEATNTNTNSMFNTFHVNYNDGTYGNGVSYTDGGTNYGGLHSESALSYSITYGFKSMFCLSNTAANWNHEWIWAMPYNPGFNPTNPFIELFANTGAGKYMLKPAQTAIDAWASNPQGNGIPYDARGKLSYTTVNGQPVVMKYIYNYDPLVPLTRNGMWYLWRGAGLHLHYAEAANRDGKGKLAWALLNTGIANTFADATLASSTNTAAYLASMITPYEEPYRFNAQYIASNTAYRGPYHKNAGVRGRSGVVAINTSYQTDMTGLESKLIDEGSLELAFEGNRWADLVRVARRRNDPSFLAERVYQKLLKDGNSEASTVRAKLMNIENWYLPFKWK